MRARSSRCSSRSTIAPAIRDKSASGDLRQLLTRRFASIQEAFVVVVPPPPVQGIGNAGGFRMMVEDRAGRGPEALQGAVYAMMGRAAQTPGVANVFSLFETSTPQLYLDIDRHKAQLLGVNIADVFATLQIYIGSSYVNDFNLFGRSYRVIAQAEARIRLGSARRADTCACATRRARPFRSARSRPCATSRDPIACRATISIPRPNSMALPAPGYSQGQAIEIMQKLAAETLPDGFSYEWTTLAFQQLRAGNTAIFAFLLAVVFVFLVLAAQFESLTLPLSIILIVPMCLIAAITGVILAGQDNNILTQVGFIVLIALAARNAVLMVEFAKQLEDRGRDTISAAVEAAKLRLRPIVMTSMAFILGVVPLVWATGRRRRAAAGARHAGVRRHDRRHLLRPDLHAGVLRRLPPARTTGSQRTPRAPRPSRAPAE